MVEHGCEAAPAYCVYITRADGEEIAMLVLSLENLANIFATLSPVAFTLQCSRSECEDELRAGLCSVARDGYVSLH